YYISASSTSTVAAGNAQADNVFITGVSQSYFDIKALEILAGRRFTANDYSRFSRIIMLDVALAEKLFGSTDAALNQIVSVNANSYLVVGV
ncbi:ABC transporter permease, partial [Streptococcus suis]